ncbi:galactocerebrosidase [Platysternon megacephalum]|uniref:Galactocerebrosidase n=1 Tax=Platysternon megacephalum TaxID=55544 RepID=A0A4D9EZI1_9SAUR|nr:galactocerebrosidase [Platysternon megacephalum]
MEAIEELALVPCASSQYLRPYRLRYRQVSPGSCGTAGGSCGGRKPRIQLGLVARRSPARKCGLARGGMVPSPRSLLRTCPLVLPAPPSPLAPSPHQRPVRTRSLANLSLPLGSHSAQAPLRPPFLAPAPPADTGLCLCVFGVLPAVSNQEEVGKVGNN